MAAGRQAVSVVPTPFIRRQYRHFKKLYPTIEEAIKTFNSYKREIPPKRLPKRMKDHVLDGKLKGVRECHLADDVLLLYTHAGNVVRMLYICQHFELYGKREGQIRSAIGGYIN